MNDSRQSGFSLMELAASTALVGSLAAISLPHFVNLQESAQSAVLESMASSLRSAAQYANLKQKAANLGLNESIIFEGQTIEMSNGYPIQSSIGLLVEHSSEFQAQSGYFYYQGLKQCNVHYQVTDTAFSRPNIKIIAKNCSINNDALAGL